MKLRTYYRTPTGISGLYCYRLHQMHKQGDLPGVRRHIPSCGTCAEAVEIEGDDWRALA